jgi:hypothetical protein
MCRPYESLPPGATSAVVRLSPLCVCVVGNAIACSPVLVRTLALSVLSSNTVLWLVARHCHTSHVHLRRVSRSGDTFCVSPWGKQQCRDSAFRNVPGSNPKLTHGFSFYSFITCCMEYQLKGGWWEYKGMGTVLWGWKNAFDDNADSQLWWWKQWTSLRRRSACTRAHGAIS